jgi:hypothetical protein
MTRAQIDDAEAAHADAAHAVNIRSVIVRSAVPNLRTHGADERIVSRCRERQVPRYAAHLSIIG